MPKGQNDDVNSLAHTKWNCKYHVVFAPKYRRKVFYEEKRLAIRDILRQLCAWKAAANYSAQSCVVLSGVELCRAAALGTAKL